MSLVLQLHLVIKSGVDNFNIFSAMATLKFLHDANDYDLATTIARLFL